MNWIAIPWELRERDQWCIAAPSGMFSPKGKEPIYLTENGGFALASSTAPSTWMSFQNAATCAHKYGYHVGYMLHKDDPYTCIDFDIKDAENAPDKPTTWTTREEMEAYNSYMRQMDSYTERSASGKGFHVWVKGDVGPGIHRKGIEVYSYARFMITTGMVVHNKPIEDRANMIVSFGEFLRAQGQVVNEFVLTEVEQEEDDWSVLRTAFRASNSEKFIALWEGKWAEEGYPSQSEADLSLLSMLTFYSPSNEQVRRLFRESALGKREKAIKNDVYINRTLRTIRAREDAERQVDVHGIVQSLALQEEIRKAKLLEEAIKEVQTPSRPPEYTPAFIAPGVAQPAPLAEAMAQAAPVSPAVVAAGQSGMPWPPGNMGKLAQFVFNASARPIKEVSIVSALGVMAGMCGRGWHVNRTGLNLYMVLVAPSAVGKEALHSGASLIMKHMAEQGNAGCMNYVKFDDFASGPALMKTVLVNRSFVNFSGELGHKLKRIADAEDTRDSSADSFRRAITDLYHKSGPDATVGGMSYSDKDKNVASIGGGAAFSLVGETTPDLYNETVTERMMADGMLSRFTIIQYPSGYRPPMNTRQILQMEPALLTVVSEVCRTAIARTVEASQEVMIDAQAAAVIRAFEVECDEKVNGNKKEAFRQMWSRASIKSLRMAALCAILDQHREPCIRLEHIEWAIGVIRTDIAQMNEKIDAGDIGMNDAARQRKLGMVINKYMTKDLPPSQEKLQRFKDKGVVTWSYLMNCVQTHLSFTRHPGLNRNLHLTVDSLIHQGVLEEIPKPKAVKDLSFGGRCFRVLTMHDGQ